MGMSGCYGPADEAESIATIHAALDAGITMLDTGDFYSAGHNEMLIRDALKTAPASQRARAFIAVKFGSLYDTIHGPDSKNLGLDCRPNAVKNFLTYTLRRLDRDHVDLYQPCRVDPAVPIEDTVGAIADMIKAGHVRHIGLSEVNARTLRRAHAVHPISALQIEYSLFSRGIEKEILPTARQLGVTVVAYGVMSRGLLSDNASATQHIGGTRPRMPRFSDENFARNAALADALRVIARDMGLSTAQLALAWVRAQGDDIIPLIGARRCDQLTEALGAIDVTLTPNDLMRIRENVPCEAVAGTRYAPAVLAHMDSEM
jgi:aryl-alcohol dehydrogenase-like predicted oxidoreductase